MARTCTICTHAERSAIDTAGRVLSLLGELLGELNRQPQVNVLVSPEWLTVRGVLLEALSAYPEARVAVVGRLAALEAGRDAWGRGDA